MESKRFDNWTRNRALRFSRRDALRLAGLGGASAAVLAVHTPAALAESTCSLTLHAVTAGGPSAPATYDGMLTFSIGSDGPLAQASFTPDSGATTPVSGSRSGRSFDLTIALSSGEALALSGVADANSPDCPSVLAGILSGPQPGDLGAWQATLGSGLSGSSSSGSASSGTGSSGTAGQSTLSCPPPQTACGPNCCPGGATCTDTNQGLCSCPSGSEQCGTGCVPICTDGQTLDLDTCTCPNPESACIQNQQTCQNHGQCCSGYCGGGTCFDCAGKVCGDFGCIDPSRDSQNCGNCGVTCILPQVCSNGVCGCAADDAPCSDHSECCSQLCFVNTCKTCTNITTGGGVPLTFCGEGVCVNLLTDIDHCGACFNACARTSGGIVCDTGVCHDINSDPNYCGFGAVVCGPGKICHLGDCIAA